MNDQNYNLALTILNNVVGIIFKDLQDAQLAPVVDVDQVRRFNEEFQRIFNARENLRSATAEELQAIINDTGPKVRVLIASQQTGLPLYVGS